jgi:hypothetical protein
LVACVGEECRKRYEQNISGKPSTHELIIAQGLKIIK